MLKVLSFKVGDLVRDTSGATGKVVAFKIDGAVIRWDLGGEALTYGDDELRMSGLEVMPRSVPVISRR